MGNCGGKADPPQRVFGAVLTQMRDEDIREDGIPLFVEDVVKYIREKGMLVPGVFRRSANAVKLNSCKEKYNAGERPDLDSLGGVNLAANALKAFFRDLRVPLLTFEGYDTILRVSAMEDGVQKLDQVKDIVCKFLPGQHITLLRTLVFFIADVSAGEKETGMTLENLAIVFAPNLLWQKGYGPSSGKVPALSHVQLGSAFVKYIIQKRKEIFAGMEKPGYVEVTL